MKLTQEWMTTWFDEFNRLYFKSELPRPRLYISHARQRLGCLGYKVRKTNNGHSGAQAYDYRLGLSNYYILQEWDYQNILLHEMIHLLIAHNGWQDSSVHGTLFRQLRDRLNNDCGWAIRISYPTRQLTVNPQFMQGKNFLVLALQTRDGKNMLTVVNRNYVAALKRQLARLKSVESYGWYLSSDPYFLDFPQVRSLRGRMVSREFYEEKIHQFRTAELFSQGVDL